MRTTLTLLLSLCFFCAWSQTGSLVTSFGTNGKLTTAFNGDLRAMAVQSDGRIVAAGRSRVGSFDDFALARYNTNGTLDNTFSSDGKQTTSIGASHDAIYDVAIQTDGKLVVAGCTLSATNDIAVARYNTDGSLDATFDGDGKLVLTVGTGHEYAFAVALQDDGKILLAGHGDIGSSTDMFVIRLNSNGTLDTSFDGDGKAAANFGGTDFGYAMALQPDGKILVAGVATNQFGLARFNSDGSLDASFDGDGKASSTFVSGHTSYAKALAVQADGKIVLTGYDYYSTMDPMTEMITTTYDLAVARYNPDGSLDAGFDGDGKRLIDLGGTSEETSAIGLQNNGKMLLAGYTGYDFALVRLNSDGSLDNSFDGDGKLTTDFGTSDIAYSLKLTGSRIYAGGSSGTNFALAAYTNDAFPLPLTLLSFTAGKQPGNVILNWTTASETNTSHFSVQRSADGRTYTTLGQVAAAGNSSEQKRYSFTDQTPLATTVWYRLLMTDKDGQSTYSTVALVAPEKNPGRLKIFPNPVQDRLQLQSSLQGNLSIRVYDAKGTLVKNVQVHKELTFDLLSLDLSSLISGVYHLQLKGEGKVEQTSFIKQ